MATEDTEVVHEKYLATLVRGEVHYLRDIRFDHGIPTVVLGYHKDHLEEHATEIVGDDDGEVMVKDKFRFEPYAGPLEVGSATSVSKALRGTVDPGTAERLRAFDARETARVKHVTAEAPPAAPFDAAARRAEIEERSRKATEEDPALPAARPARFQRTRATT